MRCRLAASSLINKMIINRRWQCPHQPNASCATFTVVSSTMRVVDCPIFGWRRDSLTPSAAYSPLPDRACLPYSNVGTPDSSNNSRHASSSGERPARPSPDHQHAQHQRRAALGRWQLYVHGQQRPGCQRGRVRLTGSVAGSGSAEGRVKVM